MNTKALLWVEGSGRCLSGPPKRDRLGRGVSAQQGPPGITLASGVPDHTHGQRAADVVP